MNDSMLTDISTVLAIFTFAFAAVAGLVLAVSAAVDQSRESRIERCISFEGKPAVDHRGNLVRVDPKLKEVKQ